MSIYIVHIKHALTCTLFKMSVRIVVEKEKYNADLITFALVDTHI